MLCVTNPLLKRGLKHGFSVFQVRFYSRWSHRTPLKVYTPEEYEEIEKKSHGKKNESLVGEQLGGLKTSWQRTNDKKESQTKLVDYQIKSRKDPKPLIATKQKSEVKSVDMLETVVDSEGNFVYTKMKDNDSRVG